MNLWNKILNINNLTSSRLFDETSFYNQFIRDLSACEDEVIIESPYITSSRMDKLKPIFKKLIKKGVSIHVVTRDPIEHEEYFKYQATNEILEAKEIGINIILIRGNHHRKVAILDKSIHWEGSLNILSQNNSKEIMRRVEDKGATKEIFYFLGLNKLI